MKKALIALAVLGAASGAAMAQSSVTLYGAADIAVGKAASTGDQKWGAQSNTLVTNNTSRIGLTGKEDLGGGLWAGFKYEGAVNLANGAAGDGGGPAGGPMWSRAAYVTLGSNSFGSVFLGRNYAPGFDGQGVYELTQWANYSVLGNTFGFGGFPDPRNNAQIEYQTPTFYGLNAEIAYIPKADGALVDNGVANRTDQWAANVVYNQGPVKAALTLDKPNKTQTGGNANKTNWSLGGSYTFGNMFALSASYNRTNNAMQWKNGGDGAVVYGARRYGWELGGSFFTGPFTVTLDFTRDTTNDLYGGRKYTNGLLEGKYSLSKRTFLYVDYLRLDSASNYSIGVSHYF
ncbi:MAG: porin [Burkholderiaceae bacterium]|jgi:predicted porin|nr:porin [Burkholderiaceae bacterium]